MLHRSAASLCLSAKLSGTSCTSLGPLWQDWFGDPARVVIGHYGDIGRGELPETRNDKTDQFDLMMATLNSRCTLTLLCMVASGMLLHGGPLEWAISVTPAALTSPQRKDSLNMRTHTNFHKLVLSICYNWYSLPETTYCRVFCVMDWAFE